MFVQVNGIEIAYDDAGAGPALVLIHAGIADRTMWNAQIREFEGNRRVIRYDLRGFGESGQSEADFDHLLDTAGLLDALDLQQVDLVGISYGGNIALHFALSFPERIRSLTLVSSRAMATKPSQDLAEVWSSSDEAFEAGNAELSIAIEMAAWIEGGRRPELLDPAFRAHAEQMIRRTWERAAEPQGNPRDPNWSPTGKLGLLNMPVCLIWGTHELPDIEPAMRKLQDGIPHAEAHVIPNCSHLAPLEHPERFNAILGEFLGKVSPI